MQVVKNKSKIILDYYRNYSILEIKSGEKVYICYGCSPELEAKVRLLLRKGCEGKIWQVLKGKLRKAGENNGEVD